MKSATAQARGSADGSRQGQEPTHGPWVRGVGGSLPKLKANLWVMPPKTEQAKNRRKLRLEQSWMGRAKLAIEAYLAKNGVSLASHDHWTVIQTTYGFLNEAVPKGRAKKVYVDLVTRLGFDLAPAKPAPIPKTPPKTISTLRAQVFYESYEWRKLRYEILLKNGKRCSCCGATPEQGIFLHVDHIKPLRKYWSLRLDPTNLQVLCEVCNHGKGNWDETDHRDAELVEYWRHHYGSVVRNS